MPIHKCLLIHECSPTTSFIKVNIIHKRKLTNLIHKRSHNFQMHTRLYTQSNYQTKINSQPQHKSQIKIHSQNENLIHKHKQRKTTNLPKTYSNSQCIFTV